jgi:type VI secretion system protein ImpM
MPGVYGKMPSNGDFVTRRLPASFLEPWDQWLREAVSDSRDQLGERWLETYLTSPVWRFALSPGTAGELAWAGVLIPSVDRVGRYFPLTLACALAASSNPVEIMSGAQSWYDSAERLILSCLEDEFDLAGFDQQVKELGAPQAAGPAVTLPPGSSTHRRMPLPEQPGDACPALLRQALGELLFAFSVWWSRGSERVEPSLLVCQGLPPSRGYAAMLTGDWARWGWGQPGKGERRDGRSGGGT